MDQLLSWVGLALGVFWLLGYFNHLRDALQLVMKYINMKKNQRRTFFFNYLRNFFFEAYSVGRDIKKNHSKSIQLQIMSSHWFNFKKIS